MKMELIDRLSEDVSYLGEIQYKDVRFSGLLLVLEKLRGETPRCRAHKRVQ